MTSRILRDQVTFDTQHTSAVLKAKKGQFGVRIVFVLHSVLYENPDDVNFVYGNNLGYVYPTHCYL